jgi:hypothetical protein
LIFTDFGSPPTLHAKLVGSACPAASTAFVRDGGSNIGTEVLLQSGLELASDLEKPGVLGVELVVPASR